MKKDRSRIVGFDRTIQLDWIESAVEFYLKGLTNGEIWTALDPIISKVLKGKDARRKCKTVIFHIWIKVPKELQRLRDEGLGLIKTASGNHRLAIHWGMCILRYAYFRDLVSTAGNMASIQSEVVVSQLIRRMVEKYGDRTTVVRATQRAVVTLKEWTILKEVAGSGTYRILPEISLADRKDIELWLMSCFLKSNSNQSILFHTSLRLPVFFPFKMVLRPSDLEDDSRFEYHRQVGQEGLLTLRRVEMHQAVSNEMQGLMPIMIPGKSHI